MRLQSAYVLQIVRATTKPSQELPRMLLVLNRSYSDLAKELAEAFKDEDDVVVTVDRRKGERRKGERRRAGAPLLSERREKDRRHRKEEVLQIILSG